MPRISETGLACIGDGLRYSPILALGLHFDILLNTCRWLLRAYTRDLKAWFSMTYGVINDMVKRLKGVVLSLLSGELLRICLV